MSKITFENMEIFQKIFFGKNFWIELSNGYVVRTELNIDWEHLDYNDDDDDDFNMINGRVKREKPYYFGFLMPFKTPDSDDEEGIFELYEDTTNKRGYSIEEMDINKIMKFYVKNFVIINKDSRRGLKKRPYFHIKNKFISTNLNAKRKSILYTIVKSAKITCKLKCKNI